MNNKQTKFLSPVEVSKIFGVARTTVSKWIDEGLLKAFITPGGHRKVRKEDVEAFIKKCGLNSTLRKKKILIVDDNPDDIRLLETAFLAASNSYEICSAEGGFEAVYKLGKFKPDLVILDLLMPDMDGFSVCQKIKSNEETKEIKVIVETAYPDEEKKQRAFACGADAFFTKPLDFTALIKKILEFLE